jgi:uncharacterized protein (TIGR03067 family)
MYLVLSVAALGLVLTGTPDDSRDRLTIAGKWRVISAKMYGKEVKQVGYIWEFGKNNQLVRRDNLGRVFFGEEGRYWLHPKKTPVQIDIEDPADRPELGGAGPRRGIVTIKNDRLTLCVAGSGDAPRPTKMASTKDDLNILLVMTRVKE